MLRPRPEMILVMLPWSAELSGRLDEHVIDSPTLRGNPLGDPHERPLWVYVPPGYDDEPDRRYPSVYVIQGYTGPPPRPPPPPPVAMGPTVGAPPLPSAGPAAGVSPRREAPPAIVVYVD